MVILDYPQLPLEKFVIFAWNDVKWPDPARRVAYASMNLTDIHNCSMWTNLWEEAAVFDTAEEADAYNSRMFFTGEIITVQTVIDRVFK